MLLHISNAFLGSKVHRNLYKSLDRKGMPQIVYTVTRQYKAPKNENLIDFSQPSSRIAIAQIILKPYHRLFFRLKIASLYKDLISQIDVSQINMQHATTLFTDGAIAYKLYKEFGIPYVVTVRNTDINYFLQLRPDLFSLARKVILNAKFITFLSPGLKENFFGHWFIKPLREKIENKVTVIYNGIEDFWIDQVKNINTEVDVKISPNRLLFVGRISKEKNLGALIDVVMTLRKKYPKLTLTIVGPWGNDENSISGLVRKHPEVVSYLGEIKEKQELLGVYREHDIFVMPSTKESFGLVYLEALTQGLPVLYTKGQGFDGVLSEIVGESVHASDAKDIEHGLNRMINQYARYFPINVGFEKFRWDNIADCYRELYK